LSAGGGKKEGKAGKQSSASALLELSMYSEK
jgi:hypothetical protein